MSDIAAHDPEGNCDAIHSADAMWREYGHKINAYDPAGKGLLQLAQDYARSSRRYSVMAGTHHMGVPAAFPLADLEAEMGRLALIEEAIEELGGRSARSLGQDRVRPRPRHPGPVLTVTGWGDSSGITPPTPTRMAALSE